MRFAKSYVTAGFVIGISLCGICSGQMVPAALAFASSSEPVDASFPMDHMILTLARSASQQAALSALLQQQQDPNSPNFHKFLTPAQFAASFGAAPSDVSQVTAWLTANGFHVDEVVPNNLAIVFSGTAAQVGLAFHSEIREYVVNGERHHANATAPEIPAALSPLVQGLVKLNDFHSQSQISVVKAGAQFTSSTSAHFLVPSDYAVIYDLNPLYGNGFSGAAQSIAIVGRSNVNPSDLATFRANYGLPAASMTPIFATGSDPGVAGNGDTLEGTLDVEWAGAAAPKANIDYVIAASTASTDGVDLAAQYAVTHNVAPILSVSYGTCELAANNAFYNNLWQQAAAQGISVFVAAGDSGAAGCDGPSAASGTTRAVNAICSTPFSTCVGGTMFNDTANPGQYWLPGNNAVMGSAVSYIPEEVWNESGTMAGGTGLAAGGGGASGIYSKPFWQTGPGVPADGHRDVPDVSLTAAQHDGYAIFYNGSTEMVSGTSAAAPCFAGIIALVNQKVGSSQGNINQVLYPLAARGTQAGSLPVFHDITAGNNSVPGVSGYSATQAYDLASGLGSVDGTQLANNWSSVTGGFTLTASALSVSASPGANAVVTLALTDLGTFHSPVTLTISSLPANVVANFTPGTITGSGSSVLTLASSGTAISGTYPITVTASGGSFTRTVSFNLVVVVATSCTLSATPTLLTVVQGQATSTKLVCGSAQGVFNSGLALSISGVPAGVTAAFSPSSIAPNSGVSSLTVNATSAATPGTYTLLVKAAAGTFSTSVNVPVTITAASTFNITASLATVSFPQGSSGSLTLVSVHSGAFNSSITLQTGGLPSTVSATLSSSSIAAPGDGSITITLQSLSVATPGTYTMTVLAQGGGLSLRIPIAVQITAAPAFTIAASAAVMTLRQSGVASLTFTTGNLTNGFNLPVLLTAGALPAGVTAAFSPSSIAAPGAGSSILTLTGLASAATGVSTFTVTAVGGTITRTINVELIVTPPPGFNVNVLYPSYAVIAGGSLTETVSATPLYGYASNINLSVTAPAGISARFANATISGSNGTTSLTIQTAASMTAGTYLITVTGTDPISNNMQSAEISLLVGTVSTTLSAPSVNLSRASSASDTITTVATSFSGNVVLSVSGLPSAVNYTLSKTSVAGSGSSTLNLSAGVNAQPGTYSVTIRATAGGISCNTTLTLIIS
jgi:uncharacterized membrane protein